MAFSVKPVGLLLALALSACQCDRRSSQPDASPPPTPLQIPRPSETAFTPVTARVSQPLCGHPEESALRKLPDTLPPCEREPQFWRYHAGGREVIVVRGKPDEGGRWKGPFVFLGGKWYGGGPPTPPFFTELGALDGLNASDARALLESVTATHNVDERLGELVLTRAELEAELAKWPDAVAAATESRQRPPAFGRDERGWHLRAWYFLRAMAAENGWQCPYASRTEWSIVDGKVHLHPLVNIRLAESHRGQPCVR